MVHNYFMPGMGWNSTKNGVISCCMSLITYPSFSIFDAQNLR